MSKRYDIDSGLTRSHKRSKIRIKTFGFGMAALALPLVAFAGITFAHGGGSVVVVDDDGKASKKSCNSNTPVPNTISAGVATAPAGSTVKVCPGPYTETVTVNKSLRIEGAEEGKSFYHRTFGDSDESTLTGHFLVSAPNVDIDGFSITNPGQLFAVRIQTAGDRAEIRNNIIKELGGPAVGTANPTGIYVEHGPDGVEISKNKITGLVGNRTAQGILVGDSTADNPSLDVSVRDNWIADITSEVRGAYGIQINNGAGSSGNPDATGYTTGKVMGNKISGLVGGTGIACPATGTPPTVPATCGWVHAIGLEGKTPGLSVEKNTVSNLTSTTVDVAAVFLQSNSLFATVEIHRNKFNLPNTQAGIALHPSLMASHGSLGASDTGNADGSCNWWNASDGPSNIPAFPSGATGSGALVTPDVDFDPYMKSFHGKGCGGWHDWDDD